MPNLPLNRGKQGCRELDEDAERGKPNTSRPLSNIPYADMGSILLL